MAQAVAARTGGPAPTPIPVPPDFPVTWEQPEDERRFWTRQVMHYPDQMTPLAASVLDEGLAPGWRAAAAAYELPVAGPVGRLVNTYLYTTMVPVIAPPEELAARGRRSQAKLSAAFTRLRTLWDERWLPEVREHLASLDRFDLTGAPLPALSAHLAETLQRFRRLYEIHFLYFFPATLATALFEELYHDLFGKDAPFGPYRLLQGFDNKSLEAGRALWQLSRRAAADPEVRAALDAPDRGVVPAALEKSSGGRAFLAALRHFLREYGRRADKAGFDSPFWIDDPAPVFNTLKQYVTQPDRDQAAELATLAAERERAVAEARNRLRGYPQPVVEQFETLLAAAQTAMVLLEDHVHWLEGPALYHVRRLLVEFGRRFVVAGVLASPGDVFYLTLDELRETAAAQPPSDRHALVAERKAQQERFSHVTPPRALGTPPPGAPPETPFTRAMGKFFGTAPAPGAEPGVLRGHPGSPGTVRGPARIVRRLAEAGKLQPGDILVAETTMPAWTPLFATVAAVVTDAGGILSHCAVVAREYRLPAVVGTGVATSALRDGQLVEVDGTAGTVRVVHV